MAALPVSAANAGSDTPSGTSAVLISHPTNSPLIVIGFLGGFVSHDEPHHPEVRLMQTLRQEYPNDAYFGLLENSKVGEAYKMILNRLDANQDGALSEDEKRRACILLFGHSWGASAVVALSRKLERKGIPVMLTVQVDSVAKPFHNDRVIPSNVLQAANFYQTRGLIHGRSKIVPADPSHTTILGNFRREYNHEPAQCRSFPWHARFFTKSHIEIECDPQVWSEVEKLLRRSLPSSLVNQTDSVEVDPPVPDQNRGTAQQSNTAAVMCVLSKTRPSPTFDRRLRQPVWCHHHDQDRVRYFREHRAGRIIQVTSIARRIGPAGQRTLRSREVRG